MRLVVVHAELGGPSSYYDDWVDAFARLDGARCSFVPITSPLAGRTIARARDADGIVLLHGCLADTVDLVEPITAALLDRRAPLVAMMGNEYATPWAPLGPRIEWLGRVAPEVVGSQLPIASARVLYRAGARRVVSIPHGLNAGAFPAPPRRGRAVGIGVRGFPYPPQVLDGERERMIASAARFAERFGFKADIDLGRRLGRSEWAAFLGRCAFTVSTEAGARWVDRADTAVRAIEPERLRPRRNALGRALRHVPWRTKRRSYALLRRVGVRYRAAEAGRDHELAARYAALDRPPGAVSGKCLTARHLDAVSTRTVQLLARGRYNDVLEPGTHFIETDPDMSNAEDVVDAVRDDRRMERMADAALEHVLAAHTVDHRVAAVVQALSDAV